MAVAQFLDFGTFVVMVECHGAGANPLVAGILVSLGLPGILIVKAALFVLVAATAIVLVRHPGRPIGGEWPASSWASGSLPGSSVAAQTP